MTVQARSVGNLLRDWRRRRRMSQLDLACDANISTKHLSFLETGRAVPSREMLMHLAERLNIPLRDQNVLLAAAGYAPMFRERSLDHPELAVVRRSIEAVLSGHDPNPALAIDRRWTLVTANKSLEYLIADVDPLLLNPPVNVLRLSLHPAGLAPRIVNLREWREHVISRLRRQIDITGDIVLNDMLEEILDYPLPRGAPPPKPTQPFDGVVVPFRLATVDGDLSFLTTTTVFGTPTDVTLSEIAIESFFPTDAATVEIMRRMADGSAISRTGVLPATVD
ncbi:MAG: helix-turn-helix domain-containing protein [Acetobacteraceae bacterium]